MYIIRQGKSCEKIVVKYDRLKIIELHFRVCQNFFDYTFFFMLSCFVNWHDYRKESGGGRRAGITVC